MIYSFTAAGELGQHEIDAEVSICGKYRAATLEDQEEQPEIEVHKMFLVRKKKRRKLADFLVDKLTDRLLDCRYNEILEAAADCGRR